MYPRTPHSPGSDYGRQKRKCRDLLRAYTAEGGDTRWAVIPGVLHADATWGAGTTEYALDLILCAVEGRVPGKRRGVWGARFDVFTVFTLFQLQSH